MKYYSEIQLHPNSENALTFIGPETKVIRTLWVENVVTSF